MDGKKISVTNQSNLNLLKKFDVDEKNILHMNIRDDNDGWDILCKFLNKEIPSVDFPHHNHIILQ